MPPVCLMVSSCCPSTVGTRGALGPGHPLALRGAGASLAGTCGSGHGQRAAESSQRALGPGWPPLRLPAQLLWLSGSDCCPQWGKCLRCSLSPWRRWGRGVCPRVVLEAPAQPPPPGQGREESLLALPLPPLGVGTLGLAWSLGCSLCTYREGRLDVQRLLAPPTCRLPLPGVRTKLPKPLKKLYSHVE